MLFDIRNVIFLYLSSCIDGHMSVIPLESRLIPFLAQFKYIKKLHIIYATAMHEHITKNIIYIGHEML